MTTDRTAAAVSAARKALAPKGITLTYARWANCKSHREAFAGDGAYHLTATRDGGWTLRNRAGELLDSGRA